jgi:hypothetical protein
MTTDKAQKRAVRARMTKTGEAYTAARQHIVKPTPKLTPLPPRVAEPEVGDVSVLAATGRDWDAWFRILDDANLLTKGHAAIAAWLVDERGVDGWWAQMVTVGYERARGLRSVNQRSDGYYVSVSKTVDVDAATAFASVTDSVQQATWVEPGTLRLRASTAPRSARFDFRGGPTRVAAFFVAKGSGRAALTIEHSRLASADDVESMRAFWRARLSALATALG